MRLRLLLFLFTSDLCFLSQWMHGTSYCFFPISNHIMHTDCQVNSNDRSWHEWSATFSILRDLQKYKSMATGFISWAVTTSSSLCQSSHEWQLIRDWLLIRDFLYPDTVLRIKAEIPGLKSPRLLPDQEMRGLSGKETRKLP